MFKKAFLITFLTLAAFITNAQINFSLSVAEKSISLNDQLYVTYTLSGTSKDVGMPLINFNDWDVISGPNTSVTQSWVNGKSSASIAYSFVLQPKQSGSLTVPSAEIAVHGKNYKSNAATVNVSKGNGQNRAQTQPSQPRGRTSIFDIFGEPSRPSAPSMRPGQSPQDFMKENNFVKVTPAKTIAYIGEPILVTYEFYSGMRLAGINVTKQPSFNGAGVIEMMEEKEPYKTIDNGKEYIVYRVRQVQLIPLKTGIITLDPAEVTADIMVNDNYGLSATKQSVIIKNNPVNITVQPLPPNKPQGFNGNIGQFSISANVERTTLPAGENNYLTVNITGKGNIEGIKLPNITYPDKIQPFTPADSQSVNKQVFPMEGSKIFKIPIIGRAEGSATIPAFSFSFFDNTDNGYKTVATQPITLTFTPPLQKGKYELPISSDASDKKYLWVLGAIALLAIAAFALSGSKKNKPRRANNRQSENEETQENIMQKKFVAPAVPPPSPVFTTTGLSKELVILEHEIQEPGFYAKAKKILIANLQQQLQSNSASEFALMEELKASSLSNLLKDDYDHLWKKINKGLYLPLVNIEERKQILETLKYLAQKN